MFYGIHHSTASFTNNHYLQLLSGDKDLTSEEEEEDIYMDKRLTTNDDTKESASTNYNSMGDLSLEQQKKLVDCVADRANSFGRCTLSHVVIS